MADAAVTFLLENVTRLVIRQVKLIAGAEDELNLLKKDLKTLKAFLRDSGRMSDKTQVFRDLENEIRDVIYEVEDAIDSCLAEALKATVVSKFFSSSRLANLVVHLRQTEVIELVKKVQGFATNPAMVRGVKAIKDESPSQPEELKVFRGEHIVGFDDKAEKIIGYLREEKDELHVISIVGMAGLGKSTLAWKVFESDFVNYAFLNRIWVNVTGTPNIKNVFIQILKKFTSEDMSNIDDSNLIETVRLYLKERKFLLVLDDVWTTKAWDDIKVVLSMSNGMSKVIVTTREKDVGEKASNPRELFYNLPFLTTEQSWELLQYEVYKKLDACPKDLEDTGRGIAKDCDGLPLSLVVIGGILVEKQAKNKDISAIKEEWLKVSKDVFECLKRDPKQRVSGIVELSYVRLPDYLRDCFLYLAVFPEDYEIPAWKLTRLWIAEGFIQGPNLEETAEEYLKDLICRNLVTVGKRNPKGEVKTCYVHDVVLAFCSMKLSQEQEKFFCELKLSNGEFNPPLSNIDKHRRLCIHSDLQVFLDCPKVEKKRVAARVRSLLCFNKVPRDLPKKHAPNMLTDFDMLRVLEAELIKLHRIPTNITKLFHLRYITLRADEMTTIKKDFSNLWNLQTLVIHTRKESLAMEADICNMLQLRHVKTKVVITRIEQGDGEGCKRLQTLSRVSPEVCTPGFFGRAPNIKRLGIQGKLAGLFGSKHLEKLGQLEKLKMVNTTSHDMPFPELRNWFPRNLKMLTIGATGLEWKHAYVLSRIETLQVLKLKSNAFTGKFWEAVSGGFCDLHFLLIEESNLFIWKASPNSFPRLRCLVLKKCRELERIPDGLVDRLEKLEIEHLSESAVESAMSIKEKKNSNQASEFKLTIGAGCIRQ